MSGRPVRALAMVSVIGALGLLGGGCGGSEDSTQVQVDKEKEEKLTNAMESYYMKNEKPGKEKEGPGKQKEVPADKAKQ